MLSLDRLKKGKAMYAIGTEIKFRDSNTTGYDVCIGHVNGDVQFYDDLGMTLVPVWTKRKGKSPTTVYVNERNIIHDDNA